VLRLALCLPSLMACVDWVPRETPAPLHESRSAMHPLVGEIPSYAERSIESLGQWVAAHAARPAERVRILHDWIADRIAYDAPALAYARIPDEDADAESVFQRRKAVCAGYANLFAALGEAAGVEIRVVNGVVRPLYERHAWNLVTLDHREYAIDVTWDAGDVDEHGFHRHYRTTYLFMPLPEPGGDHLLPARDEVEAAILQIEPELDAIWASATPAAARRALILEFWSDADDGWAGEEARLVVEAWVRRHLPEGSREAFGAAELDRFNRGRSGRRFAPYL
jgi:hypothetical protein